MSNFVSELIYNYGYLGMFLGMILEAVIIVIPSELILATGGILVAEGHFNFLNTFVIGIAGSMFCAIIIYFIGYLGGTPFVKKYGKYFFMKEEDINKSNTWFNKYGMISALICRNFPIVRTLISLPIGIMKLSFVKFVIYTTIGSIPWTFIFIYVGYILGDNWVIMKNYVNKLKIPILVLLVYLVISYFIKKILKKEEK